MVFRTLFYLFAAAIAAAVVLSAVNAARGRRPDIPPPPSRHRAPLSCAGFGGFVCAAYALAALFDRWP